MKKRAQLDVYQAVGGGRANKVRIAAFGDLAACRGKPGINHIITGGGREREAGRGCLSVDMHGRETGWEVVSPGDRGRRGHRA